MVRLYIFMFILVSSTLVSPTQCMQQPSLLVKSNQMDPAQGGDIFYTLFTILSALDQYDRNQISSLEIDFSQGGFNYSPELGDNWWTYYFKDNVWGTSQVNIKRIPDYQKYIMYLQARFDMPTERLHALYKKYITIHDAITNAANYTSQYYFKDHPVIGIYYHAGSNAPEEMLFKTIKQQCKQHKTARIFLVTSDYQISMHLKAKYGSRLICSPYTLYKSPDESLASFSKGLLINCLLLAKCNVLIKTSNALSACVSVCNPQMPIITLDQEWLEKE